MGMSRTVRHRPLRLPRRIPARRWVLPAPTAPVVPVSLCWRWDRTAVAL